jgi:uncharacterized protein YbaA (DUF1428 family)
MAYVDGFVLPVTKAKLEAYKEMARRAEAIFREHGAISYVESIGDDVPYGELTSFPRAVQAEDGDVVVMSWVVWPDKSTRDAGNKKVMEDPRLQDMMKNPAFNPKKMIYGGFVPFLGL